MDCKHARLLLAFVRPNNPEVDASETNALNRHLESCPDCATLARDDQRADDQIGRAMNDVPLPENLRQRLLNRLNAERDAWRRRWLLRAAAAAAVLLAVFLGVHAYWSQPAKIDPEQLAALNHPQFPKANTEEVEKAFKVMAAAPELRVHLIKGYQLAVFQKQQVPYLLLTAPGRDGPAVAHVHVLSKKQFDWDDARNLPNRFQSGTVRVSVQDINTQFFYVMIYTAGDQDLFLVPRPPPET